MRRRRSDLLRVRAAESLQRWLSWFVRGRTRRSDRAAPGAVLSREHRPSHRPTLGHRRPELRGEQYQSLLPRQTRKLAHGGGGLPARCTADDPETEYWELRVNVFALTPGHLR